MDFSFDDGQELSIIISEVSASPVLLTGRIEIIYAVSEDTLVLCFTCDEALETHPTPKKFALKIHRDEKRKCHEKKMLDLLTQLQGEFVPKAYTTSIVGYDCHVIGFEWLSGHNLWQYSYDRTRIDQTPDMDFQNRRSLQNLDFIYRGVVECYEKISECGVFHSDCKLDNIFLTDATDGQRRVVLIDFDLAEFPSEYCCFNTGDAKLICKDLASRFKVDPPCFAELGLKTKPS